MKPLNPRIMYLLFLIIAIFCEVFATTSLKACEGFTKLWPSIFVVIGYGLSFYFFSLCVQHMNLGVAYAIWAGVGILFVTISSIVIFKQKLDLPAIIGIIFILSGVLIVNLFSKSLLH